MASLTRSPPALYSAAVTTRRKFLTTAVAGAALRPMLAADSQAAAWDEVPKILARIRPPVFPNRDFNITSFGAKPGGKDDATDAIRQAIAACNRSGGGRVVVPEGTFLTGPVVLRSNVNLHLVRGATLLFHQDPERYLPLVRTRFEGVELLNYSPFIYADAQENIAVTGEGTLDGNADEQHWWPWRSRDSRKALYEMGEKDVPVEQRIFGNRRGGDGHRLRPCFFQPCHSRNVLIEGVTIVRSPMWEVTPFDCSNVTVRGVKIVSHGPNNDGCDPDSCRDVLIENCSFDTGDDCIAIKSGRNRDGRRVGKPSENIIIRNCEMKDGHGGITIGSEMSGGVRNVFVENCRLSSPHLNQALRFKTNAMRGGTIENVYFRNIQIGEIAGAILQIDFQYEEGPNGPEKPLVRNIDIRDVTSKQSKYALELRGFANAPIQNVFLDRCNFEGVAQDNVVEHVEGLAMNQVRIQRR